MKTQSKFAIQGVCAGYFLWTAAPIIARILSWLVPVSAATEIHAGRLLFFGIIPFLLAVLGVIAAIRLLINSSNSLGQMLAIAWATLAWQLAVLIRNLDFTERFSATAIGDPSIGAFSASAVYAAAIVPISQIAIVLALLHVLVRVNSNDRFGLSSTGEQLMSPSH